MEWSGNVSERSLVGYTRKDCLSLTVRAGLNFDSKHVLRKIHHCTFRARNLESIVNLKNSIYPTKFPNDLLLFFSHYT